MSLDDLAGIAKAVPSPCNLLNLLAKAGFGQVKLAPRIKPKFVKKNFYILPVDNRYKSNLISSQISA